MKNIFNVYVEMDSQATCNRMKQICIDNGLPISLHKNDWIYVNEHINVFTYDYSYKYFNIGFITNLEKKKVIEYLATETEFIELLKQYKNDNI